jgi:Zn-finger nucleic acid-binding protein
MNCPACTAQLAALSVEGLIVDVCRGCGGIWFDNFELDKVDEAHESLGNALVAFEFGGAHPLISGKRACPKCLGITMLQHRFSPDKPVMIDECPACGGVWLDGGELAEIRRPAPSTDDRKKAAQRFFDRMFIEDLARLKARRADKLQRQA